MFTLRLIVIGSSVATFTVGVHASSAHTASKTANEVDSGLSDVIAGFRNMRRGHDSSNAGITHCSNRCSRLFVMLSAARRLCNSAGKLSFRFRLN